MVPLLTETAAGLRAKFTIHGGDYSTRDGSCIRDYIHVMDLAHAHTLCLRYLQKQTDTAAFCEVFNVGIGQGVSVLEAVQALENIAQKSVPHTIGSRRAGDVVAIYANYDKAARLLGWQPKYSLHDIMRTAWAWQNRSSNKK
jgi:UDP-glucose 4-epimerase